MKALATIAAISLIAVGVAGCQTMASDTPSVSAAPAPAPIALAGRWALLELNGVPIRPGAVVLDLQSNGRFVATVYCNEARGLYAQQGRSLSFDGWDATERGCGDDTAQVGAIGAALRGDGYLVGVDASGDLLLTGPARMRFRRNS